MSTFILVASWVVAIWFVVGSLAGIAKIGKPREPLTPGIAITSIVLSLIVAWLLVGAR